MRAHYDTRTGVDAGAERHELHGIEVRVGGADRGQPDVRVDVRVAMSGEMLQRGKHPMLLETAHIRAHQPRDGMRVLTEGADVDDRVERIVVDVRVGGE